MFWPDVAAVNTNQRKRPPTRQQQKQQRESTIDVNATGCDACGLKSTWARIATPKMPLSGNVNGEVLALAEAPGEMEDRKGTALVGPSGELLREHIPSRHRDNVAYQNIARCRPDANRTPTPQEAHACSPFLDADIANMPNLRVILGLGAVPLRRFFPGASITKVHGLRLPVRVGDRTLWYFPAMHPAAILHSKEKDSQYEPPSLPVFRADIKNCFNNFDAWNAPRIVPLGTKDVILPKSYDEAYALVQRMSEPIGLDLENIKLRPYENGAELLTGALSDDKITIAFSVNHPSGPTAWGLRLLMDTVRSRRWVAHNAAHELSWLLYAATQEHSILTPDLMPFDDSMACARIAFERESVLALDDVSQIVLGTNIKSLTNVDAKRIMDFPLDEVLVYNGLDAKACRLVWQYLHRQIDQAGYDRIIGAIRSTTPMEIAGLPVSQTIADELKQEWQTRRTQIRIDARQLYEVRQFEAERGIEFNIGSNEHVGTALVAYSNLNLPRTNKGKGDLYSTEEQELRKYANDNELARAVLDDREAGKIVSTYIEPTLEAPSLYPDGNLHPTYTTMLVSTLRLSSRGPNVQNYPQRKHSEVRRQFPAPPGYLYAKFDYGQLEARILAMASRDKRLVKALIDKFDIHSYWLNKVINDYYPDYLDRLADKTGETEEKKLRKEGRNLIKGDLVFNALYGGGADNITLRTGIPLRIVQDILAEFWEEYRGVKNWHKARRQEYRDTGAIVNLTGRVRRGIMLGNEPINCVDFETEVLSQRGWLNGNDAQPGDVLLTMNSTNKTMEWQPATDIRRFPNYSGPVHHLSSKSFSAVTTPDHRWAWHDQRGSIREATSATLPGWGCIPRVMPFASTQFRRRIYSDDWVRLVGWVLTDGYYPGSHRANWGGTCAGVCQSKPENVTTIDALFQRLDLPAWRRHVSSSSGEVFWQIYEDAGRRLCDDFPARQLTPQFLCELTIDQLNILFDTMVAGCGSIESNGRESFCAGERRRQQIDNFQMLSVLCGRPVALDFRHLEGNKRHYESMSNQVGPTNVWYARCHKRRNLSLGSVKRQVINEQRGMWCPMVPNTYVIVRRKGRVYITGNTPIQSTAADIVVEAMNELAALSRREHDFTLHPRINIHDDITLFLPEAEDEMARYIDVIHPVLTKVRFPFQIVPLTVELKIGPDWATMYEVATFEGTYRH